MAVDVVPDVELIEHLDFDVEVACEVAWHDGFKCGEPVAGVIRCRVCTVSRLSSTKCWERFQSMARLHPAACAKCGRPAELAFEFLPTGGAN